MKGIRKILGFVTIMVLLISSTLFMVQPVQSVDGTGSISGTVSQSDDTPIGGAEVIAFDHAGPPGGLVIRGQATTDGDGNYSISDLDPNEYDLRVVADGYASEWYDGVYHRYQVTPVEVTSSSDTSPIDFTLEPGASIMGNVSDGTDPIEGARIRVFYYDSLSGSWEVCGVGFTDADGDYRTSGLLTGEYGVSVEATGYATEWYDNTYYVNKATSVPVDVELGDTTGIDFTLGPGSSIMGNVSDGTNPIEGAQVIAFYYDTLPGSWVSFGGTWTGSDGSYEIAGLHNDVYAVRVTAEGYATEWWENTYYKDEATPIEVTPPDNETGIDFILGPGGSISGQVTYLDGVTPTPIAGLHVFAIESDTFKWVAGANTDTEGNYVLSGLPEDIYIVRVCACCSDLDFVDEWYNNKSTRELADTVPVSPPGETSGIDFVLDIVVPRSNIEDAIADGLAWLVAQQNPDGSWGEYYQVSSTGLAVLKLVTYAREIGMDPFDPDYEYSDETQAGYDFLFKCAHVTDVTIQLAGDPDTNGNNIGVYFRSPLYPPGKTHDYDIYDTSIALMAIAADSSLTDAVVHVPGSAVDGWTFAQVAQDAVDYLAWGQTDFGFGRGGWNYMPMNNAGPRSDQSNSGWVTLGLAYAEHFGASILSFVRTELDVWIDYIQDNVDGDDNDGGSWYTGPGDDAPGGDPVAINILKTGNLLQQMAFVGDTAATPRVVDAIDYLVRHWDENFDPGWKGCPSCYQTTYTTMKGLEALTIDTIDSTDWFQNFVDAILGEQAADGWWPSSRYDIGDRILSTEWALLTLEKVAPPPPPQPELCPPRGGYRWGSYSWDPFPIVFVGQQEVQLTNTGEGSAYNVVATVVCAPINVDFSNDPTVTVGEIPASESRWSTDTFELRVDMTCPQDPNLWIVWEVEYYDEDNVHHVVRVPKFCGETTACPPSEPCP